MAHAFGLDYSINAIAMPMIGGTSSWLGPLIGAVLLAVLQQAANVTISSVVNLLIVGVLLTVFIVVAPNGILGLLYGRAGKAAKKSGKNSATEKTVEKRS
jgi:branched-chain amino acid transport system permease protein